MSPAIDKSINNIPESVLPPAIIKIPAKNNNTEDKYANQGLFIWPCIYCSICS